MTSALSFKAGVDPELCASCPVCNGIIRFTSSATPADLLLLNVNFKTFFKLLNVTEYFPEKRLQLDILCITSDQCQVHLS